MLIVTGASGQLGRKIIDHLLQRVPAETIGASVRNPDALADLAAHGVRVRHGDFADPQSLLQAWEGADRVLLVSSNAAATGGDPLEQHANAIDAARQLKVKRVLYTSQISSSPDSLFPPARHHAATEAMLARSGLAWTALRHGFYAESAVAMNSRGLANGDFAGPADGKVSWTTHDDLAEADAILLSAEHSIDGITPPLTASEALDLSDLAHIISQTLGKPITRSLIDDDIMESTARSAGVPQERIAVMLGYYRAARAGEFDKPNPTLAKIIGRQPKSMQAFLAERLTNPSRA